MVDLDLDLLEAVLALASQLSALCRIALASWSCSSSLVRLDPAPTVAFSSSSRSFFDGSLGFRHD